MSMSTGSKKAEINVTPMIDVLLVLIIIFMVIAPARTRGLNALVPQPAAADDTRSAEQSHAIVITVYRDNRMQLNQEWLDLAALQQKLESLFRHGAPDVVFVRGEKDLEFRYIAQVIDMARGAGVYRVALMTTL